MTTNLIIRSSTSSRQPSKSRCNPCKFGFHESARLSLETDRHGCAALEIPAARERRRSLARALHPITADLCADSRGPLRSVRLPITSADDNKDGGDKPMPRRVDLCGTYGCTLPDKHRGLHQFPPDESRRKRSKPDWSQPTRRKSVKFERMPDPTSEPGPEPDGEPEDDFCGDGVEDEDEDEDDVEDEDDEEDAGEHEEGGSARETRALEEKSETTSVRSPRKAAAEATLRVAALAGPRPASSPPSAAATGPATCERCAKAAGDAPPELLCFARVSERCRAQAGRVTSTARWHHVSVHEHFCHDCVEHYGRGEARRVWQSQQAHGKWLIKPFKLCVCLLLPLPWWLAWRRLQKLWQLLRHKRVWCMSTPLAVICWPWLNVWPKLM